MMSNEKTSPPSFSRVQRWKNLFDRTLRTLLVVAVVVMANYLGAKFSHRFYLSSSTRVELSPRTLSVLRALTNKVDVILYFDKQSDFYPDVAALLDEYHAANKKLSVRLVDYVHDPGEAQKIKIKYNLTAAQDKDLIIFDLEGRTRQMPATALVENAVVGMTEEKKLDIRPVRFNGERIFTAMLLSLENPQPGKAYFLTGHGEVPPNDSGPSGFLKFSQELQQNYFGLYTLELAGPGTVPADCDLLIIAAPRAALSDNEVEKIENYLRDGGRLFVLFNLSSLQRDTNLEPLLKRWGLQVSRDFVVDMTGYTTSGGQQLDPADIVVSRFGKHPVTSSLNQMSVLLQTPRAVQKGSVPNNLQADELLFTSENSRLSRDRAAQITSFSLAAAVEEKPVAGKINPRGTARLIVVGDSTFLGNNLIEFGANRDFLNSAINWLVARPQLVEGVGPRPITEFRLLMTAQQQYQLRWLLLGALPGSVLLAGWLVWFVRRK